MSERDTTPWMIAIALLIGVLLSLGSVGWWILSRRQDALREAMVMEQRARAAQATALAEEAQAPPKQAARDRVTPDAKTSVDARVTGGGEALAPEQAPKDDPDRWQLEVVDAVTFEPLPGAHVALVDMDQVGESPIHPMTSWNLDTLARSRGRWLRADDEGRVGWGAIRSLTFVMASSAGLWGFLELTETPRISPVVLALEPRRTLTLRVVDPEGRVAGGIPVAIYTAQDETQIEDIAWRGETGPDGTVEVPHLRQMLELHDAELTTAVATLDLPVAWMPVRPIDLEQPPSEPLVLELPPTGALDVILEHSDGSPVTEDAYLLVDVADDVRFGDSEEPLPFSPRRLSYRQGDAVIEHVGLDTRIVVVAGLVDHRADIGSVELSGPSSPGETVQALVTLGTPRPVLTALVVDEEGTALGGHEILISVQGVVGVDETGEARRGTIAQHRVMTDAGGRMELVFPAGRMARNQRTCLFESWSEDGATGAHGELDLSRSFPPGTTDLGTITLTREPILATGRVVTTDEVPVNGCRVQAVYAPSDSADVETTSGPMRLARTDGDGTFEIRGPMRDGALRLSVHRAGYLGRPAVVEVAPGDRDVRLVVDRSGSIEGRILLEESLSARLLTVLVERRDTHDAASAPEACDASSRSGRFRCEGLGAGAYTVTVRLRDHVLAEIDDIVVEGGHRTAGGRLDPIDLRGRLRSHRLRIRNQHGDWLADESVTGSLSGSTSEDGFDIETDRHGRCRVLTLSAETELVIAGPETGSARVTWSDGEQIVTLDQEE